MPLDSTMEEDWTALGPEPSLAIAKQFWSAYSPSDPAIRLRFVMHDRSAPAVEQGADSMDAIWPLVVGLQGQGYECYYLSQITKTEGSGWGGQMKDEDVTGIRALAADFDKGLPTTWHEPPSITVHSSMVDGVQKGQALWLVSDCPVAEFRTAQERLIAHYGSDASIVNPSRILRLPGSLHQKGAPQLVTFIGDTAPTPRPLTQLLHGLPPVAPRKEKATGERGVASFTELMSLLPYVDPSVPQKPWLKIISATKNTDFIGAPEGGEDVMCQWAAGDFYNGPKDTVDAEGHPKWRPDGTPVNYEGEEDVRKRYRSNLNRASYGSLKWTAEQNGWKPNAGGYDPNDVFPGGINDQPGTTKPADPFAPELVQFNDANDEDDWPISVRDLLKRPVPRLPELIPGYLEKLVMTYFEGPGSSYKSRIALQDTVCVCIGRALLNEEPVEIAKGLYLSYEDDLDEVQRRLAAMIQSLKLTDAEIEMLHDNLDIWPMKQKPRVIIDVDHKGVATLTRFGKRVKHYLMQNKLAGHHTLIVFDGMLDAVSFGGNTMNETVTVSRVIREFDRWGADLNCSGIAIIHPSRAAERSDTAYSSSYAAAWTTKPRAIQKFKRHHVIEGQNIQDNTPYDKIKVRRFVSKRSHGKDGYHIDLQYRSGAMLAYAPAVGTMEPVDAAVRVVADYRNMYRILQNGKGAGSKGGHFVINAAHTIMQSFRQYAGEKQSPGQFILALKEAVKAEQLRYVNGEGKTKAGYELTAPVAPEEPNVE
jgi:hypothetical protein